MLINLALLFDSVSSSKDCAFADPLVGGSHSFQQRLNELTQLETDTVKYERSRKLKRKPKQIKIDVVADV